MKGGREVHGAMPRRLSDMQQVRRSSATCMPAALARPAGKRMRCAGLAAAARRRWQQHPACQLHRSIRWTAGCDTMAQEARQALEAATELSKLLDCGLDKEALSICIALLEQGVNPEVMASKAWGRCGPAPALARPPEQPLTPPRRLWRR